MKIYNTTLLKGDIIIIASVIALALVTFLLTLEMYTQNSNLVEVYIDGEKIHTLPLQNDTTIIIEETYQNTIVIENNKVKVTNSTCPDGICENFGNISTSGQTIICMPNRLVVTIAGELGELGEFEVDIIT